MIEFCIRCTITAKLCNCVSLSLTLRNGVRIKIITTLSLPSFDYYKICVQFFMYYKIFVQFLT